MGIGEGEFEEIRKKRKERIANTGTTAIEKAQEEKREAKSPKCTFQILFYTPEKKNFSRKVEIPENDPNKAIQAAAEEEGLKGYYEATAVLLPLRKR
ncbi:MAG: hypothetical protein Q8N88_06735 [Nanoarchaeota archaeon]|nr:hypothetical protein [Nanoarchaeota archaeon]